MRYAPAWPMNRSSVPGVCYSEPIFNIKLESINQGIQTFFFEALDKPQMRRTLGKNMFSMVLPEKQNVVLRRMVDNSNNNNDKNSSRILGQAEA